MNTTSIKPRKYTQRKRQFNTYKFTENYVIGYDVNNNEFYLDTEDYNFIKDYTWYKDIKGYITTKINGKIIKMHRFILSKYYDITGKIYDHKNTVRYDNKKV